MAVSKNHTGVSLLTAPHADRTTDRVASALRNIGMAVSIAIRDKLRTKHMGKADSEPTSSDQFDEIEASNLADLALDEDWTVLTQALTPEMERQFRAGGVVAWADAGLPLDEDLTSHVDANAIAYAEERAAELVGKRVIVMADGTTKVIDNPDALWSIQETTRNQLRAVITDAVADSSSYDQLADEILNSYPFSETRAEMIARTELAFAHVQGGLVSAHTAGAIGKKSLLGSEHDHQVPAGDQCDTNADEGPIPIDSKFESGDMEPPYHPNCVCDIKHIYSDDKEAKDIKLNDAEKTEAQFRDEVMQSIADSEDVDPGEALKVMKKDAPLETQKDIVVYFECDLQLPTNILPRSIKAFEAFADTLGSRLLYQPKDLEVVFKRPKDKNVDHEASIVFRILVPKGTVYKEGPGKSMTLPDANLKVARIFDVKRKGWSWLMDCSVIPASGPQSKGAFVLMTQGKTPSVITWPTNK